MPPVGLPIWQPGVWADTVWSDGVWQSDVVVVVPIVSGLSLTPGGKIVAANRTDICNQALAHIGQGSIVDFITDLSNAAVQCRLFFDDTLYSLYEDMEWTFTTKRAVLTEPLQNAPLFGFTNAFQLPEDCMIVLEALEDTSEWRVEGQTILTNEDSIRILYTYRQGNTLALSSKFREAFSYRLAEKLAMPLTRNLQIMGSMHGLAEQKKSDAMAVDSRQGSRRIEPLDNLISVRYSG